MHWLKLYEFGMVVETKDVGRFVIVLCFVVRYFMSILVLQSS